jgi:L,D-peptidoglycan transpeptidase YkuD (ErfK/YbiS/YcfS/YnhG family)
MRTLRSLTLAALAVSCVPAAAQASPRPFQVPASADQLLVVSSPTRHPAGDVATFRAYERAGPSSPWRLAYGRWTAEIGYAGLRNNRREGDGSTPTGVYGIGHTMYGNRPDPRGLDYHYHRLRCGDWWDEDPYSGEYNHFVHVACGTRPAFASWSEALWTERTAYPYLAVIRFNMDPVKRGRDAPGSGIFLHSWVGGPTAGCVALHRSELLAILRWLSPRAHPVIAIGTRRELRLLHLS